MRIHRPGILQAFWIMHPDAEGPLRAWFHEAKNSTWDGITDIRSRHREATELSDGRFSFDICEAKYRLSVRIDFAAGIVVICAIGVPKTHGSEEE